MAAAEDIPDQAFPTVEALLCRRQGACRRRRRGAGRVACCGRRAAPTAPVVAAAVEACLDKGKAPANPVAVATVDQLVGASGEAPFGRVLPGRQPGNQSWNVQVAVAFISSAMRCSLCHARMAWVGGCRRSPPPMLHAHLGMLRPGWSRSARQPSAQKAYAPWASAFGWPEMPPSKVWPGWVRNGSGRGRAFPSLAYIVGRSLPRR